VRQLTALVLAILIAFMPAGRVAAQQSVPAGAEAQAFRQVAAAIPLGSQVKLQTNSGRRMTATLMSVTDVSIIVKRVKTRVPEPAVEIQFGELARLQRDQGNGAVNMFKAIGLGVAAGVGSALLTFAAIALAYDD
jgi:hypothetical protein